jgi:hypothetical protein
MKSSSQLTRMLVIDWLKQNRGLIIVLPLAIPLIFAFAFNPIVSSKPEAVLVVRNQQIPDKYAAVTIITFIELPNGRNATLVLPNGAVPPAPGSSIRVMHSQHLLLGDSFQFIQ